MNLLRTLAAGLALLVLALPCLAQGSLDQTLFGPKQYVRTTGAPNQYNDSFSVPASAGAPFLLRIANGDSSGAHRISSGWIKVNGVQVVGPADFGNNVALIERSLNLSPSNTVEVRLASAPGGVITLRVLGTRIPPVPTSLAPNPLALSAGATATLTATLSPAPAAAGTLAVSSANGAVAAVPASVPFAVGQTSVQIPVTGVAAGTTSITASANGGSASATVNVTPAPPTITSLAPATLTVTQASTGTLTVSISAAQASDTAVALTSSNSGIASVPSTITVAAGQVSAPITVNALSPGDADISATLNGSSASSHVTVTPLPPTVVSLVPAVSTVTLGAGTSLTLTISATQATDTTVPIAVTPAGIVTAPAQVIVPAGQTQVGVPIGTLAYGQAGVTASLNGSTASAAVNVVPPPVAVIALEPATFVMNVGATSTFTVRINAAQTTNTDIALESSDAAVLQVPLSVTVAQGATSATFTATGLAVGNATITASANGTSRTASVHVAPQPAAVASLLPSPLPLQQGATGSLTVTINVAQETDTTIAVASSAAAVAAVPASVVVPAGAISALVSVNALTPGTALVTASVNGTSASSSVEVTPPPPIVSAVTPATLSLPKGTPGVLRVTVSRAPNVATAVALASSAPAIASVPPQVNIPAGALFADFPVTSNTLGQAIVTATLNGGSASSTVTVAPAELVTLTLSPQAPTNYAGESVPFTATGTMTDGTSEDFTARVTWSSSNTAVASIAATGVASALALGQTTITASFTFNAVQTGEPVTVTQSTVLTVKVPTPLVLSTPTTGITAGDTITVTVTTSDAPPFGGLVVNLAGSGTGSGTFPASVTIPEYQTSVTFQFAATGAGDFTLTATAQNRLPGTLVLAIAPQLRIDAVTPSSGAVGELIVLSGSGFDLVAANNALVFRGINNTTVPTTPVSSTATAMTVKVPALADSGPITLTNSRGTAQSPPFTVTREQDFQLVVSPATVSVYQAASNGVQVQLASTGSKTFTGLVSLSVQGLPSGVAPTFTPQTLSALQAGTITLGALASTVTGTYSLTITGEIKEGGRSFTRTATATLNVLASAGVTGIKGRFVNPQGAGIAGVIVRADIATTPQPQTTTDASGSFQLAGLPAGVVTLRFDATPAHPLYPIWPQNVTVPAGKILVMEDWIINPPPPDERFTTISPNSPQDQVITDPRFPGLKITIPAGTSIIGWDGVPKSRLAVERLDPDKLPVAAPPIKTKSVYQLYFGTPMGGLPSSPIPVTLPNDLGLEPGKQTDLYYYDGSPMGGTGEWKKGGTGTVSADGSVIITDAGSGIPRFCGVCGLPCFKAAEDEAPNNCPNCQATSYTPSGCASCDPGGDPDPNQYGKPVNLATGQEVASAVDLVVNGEVPIVIRRVFNPFDGFAYVANFQQSLGVNWTIGGYDVAMLPFGGDFGIRLVLPGNARVDFQRGEGGKFRTGGTPIFDGAEISKIGGSNPTNIGLLAGGSAPPAGAPLNATCFFDGSFYTLRFKDGREWRFDAAPNATKVRIAGGCLYFLSEMRDPQGRVVSIARSDGKITRVSTSSGQFVNFGYSNGVVSSVTDNLGRTVTYSHETVPTKGGFRGFGATTAGGSGTTETAAIAAGLIPIPPRRLVSASTPDGVYAYTYEDDPPSLRLGGLSFTDGSAAISTEPPSCQNVRGGTRLKTIQIPGVQGVFTNFYGPSKRVLRQTWPDGTEILFNYKIVGGCVPGLRSLASQPTEGAPIAGGSNTTTCSGAGCIRTDSWGGDAVTGGSVVGVEVIDSRGKNFSRDFNQAAIPVKTTDTNGQPITIVRDAGDRVLSKTDALGRVTSYQYDSRGNRTKVVDPAGRETTITYDPKWNKPTLVSQRLEVSTVIEHRFSYDPDTGVLLTSTDPEQNITSYQYDANSRLAAVTDPLLHVTRIEYDGQGHPSRIADHLGNSVQMVTDSAARIVQTVDALGHETQSAYNNLNRLTKFTDALNGETSFNFDTQNRLTSVVNPRSNTIESYGYDSVGRLLSKTDAKNRSETYGYDGNGNLTTITDRRLQVTTIGYDNANRPIRIQYQDGTVQERTYDAAGRLVEIREPDSAQQMEYDLLDRMTRVITDSLAGRTTISNQYDNLDRRTKRTVSYPGGVLEETTYVYDKASRLRSISQTGVNGTQVTNYEWDAANRLTRKTLPNALTEDLSYDEANRLLAITYKKSDASIVEEVTYSYDANGRRTSRTIGTPSPRDSTFAASFDEANRMTSITLDADGTPKTYLLSYDDQGNLTQKQNAAVPAEVTTYLWDARNRLATITTTDGTNINTANFRYDVLGRRIERLVAAGAVVQRTQYVYEGLQPLGELVDGRLTSTLLTGLKIDEVIARTVNISGGNPVATKSYLVDALGSVLAMTNAAQNPEVFYSYSAYGETTQLGVDADLPANSNQYAARENDGTVGGTNGAALYYYRARYYDPVLKRFISEDPIGLAGGPNVYAYVGNDPLRFTDPFGLDCQLSLGVGGLVGFQIPWWGNGNGGFIGGGTAIGITSNGQVFIQFSYVLSQGIGAYAGVGVQGGVSASPSDTPAGLSVQESLQFDANAGWGGSVGGSVQVPRPSSGQNGGGFSFPAGGAKAGVGYGAQASVGINTQSTIATGSVIDVPSFIKNFCSCKN